MRLAPSALTRFEARATSPLSPLLDIDLQLSTTQSSLSGPAWLLIRQGSSNLGLTTETRHIRGFSTILDGLPVHPLATVGDAFLDRQLSILAEHAINRAGRIRTL